MHDLDYELPRSNAFQDFFAEGGLTNGSRELLYDLEIYVGFEKRSSDLPQSLVNVGFAHDATAGDPLERRVEPFR